MAPPRHPCPPPRGASQPWSAAVAGRLGWLAALIALFGVACAPPPKPEPVGPSAPIVARSRAGATLLDVREIPSGPRFTMVGRAGDPRPALVVAIAAHQGSEMNAALAGLLAARLRAAGVTATVQSDGAGIRIHHPIVDDTEPFLAALAVAMAAPISAGESALEEAVARVETLKTHPLDAAALLPLARCEGRGAALASALRWRNDAPGLGRLETARREGLVRQRTAVAAVGSEQIGEAVASSLASVSGWPDGSPASTAWPSEPAHGAFRTNALAAGRWRLDVALRVGSGVAAASVARRLRDDAPLHGKLASLPHPWKVTAVRATAMPRGGCLSLRVIPSMDISPRADAVERATGAATQVARVMEAELALALREPTDAFEVTREIIEADSAAEVAQRAAWWVLSQPVEEPPVVSTALATSAEDALPTSPDDEALTSAYRDSMRVTRLPPTDDLAAEVVSVEPGQGQLWMMVANPCALSHEGLWDGGRAALGAAAAAAGAATKDVRIDPWVSGDGVGLIARGGLRRPDEPAENLARRVADALGRAYTQAGEASGSFDVAKRAVLAAYGGERGLAIATFAQKASPTYPGWLAPWGLPGRTASVTASDARQRWQEVIQGPTRVAVIANQDAAQADAAIRRLERWLPPTDLGDRCPERGATAPAEPGDHPLRGGHASMATAAIGVAFDEAERPLAALTRARLRDPSGPLRRANFPAERVEVELVHGGERAALVVLLQTRRDRIAKARRAVLDALESLAEQPPDVAAYERAAAAVEAEDLARRALPVERLVRLWRKDAPDAEGDRDAWVAWLTRRLRPEQVIVVSEHLPK